MKQNITLRGILANAKNLAALFLFILISVVATSCGQTEDYALGEKKPPIIAGDTIPSFDAKNTFTHGDWDFADGLAQRENKNYGYINLSVNKNGETTVIGSEPLDEKVKMSFKWTPIEELQGKAQLTFISAETTFQTMTTTPNGRIKRNSYPSTSILKFDELDLEVKGLYDLLYAAGAVAEGDEFKSLSYEFEKTDTLPEIIKKEEGDFKRGKTTAYLVATLNHLPSKEVHTVKIPFNYTGIFRVNIAPGEKVYVGKTVIEGSGDYYPLPNGNFHTEIKYLKTFTQDRKTITEEAPFSGEARIIWTILKDNLFPTKTINIGNPVITPNFTDDEDFTVKDANMKFKVRHHTFDCLWEILYSKQIRCDVDCLYAVDEHDVYELPTGESTLGYAGYIPGQATETTEYSTYNDGVLKFVGNHASKKDYPLEVGQVFQVKKDRKFIGYEFPKTFDPSTGKSKIEVYEIWEGEPKKLTDTYETTMTHRKHGEPESRFYGNSLSFTSGLTKTVSEADYTAEANGVMATIETTAWAARLSLGTSSAYYERSKKHVMHGNKKVEFQGYPAPTAAEFGSVTLTNTNDNFVEGDDTYTRRSYNVSFTIDGETIINKVNVDALQPKTPTVDPEFGYLDGAKTVQFGRVSICWDVVNGKLTPRVSVSVITSVGVLNSIDKVKYFYKMDVNTISHPLSACLKVGVGNKFIPASAEIKKGTGSDNTVWSYLGIDGTSPTSVNNADVVKLGVKEVNPFISAPEDGTQTFVNKNGRVIVKYKGEVIFDEVFPVK